MTPLLDEATQRAHKQRNTLHSVLLLGGLALMLAVPTYLTMGLGGLIVALGCVGIVLMLAPRMPAEAVMRMYGARRVLESDGGELVRITKVLSDRAELDMRPALYVIPSPSLNAFATGSQTNAAIGITTGLLRQLNQREVAGVIAHEISHIRNNDLWVMGIADIISRFTLAMSYAAFTLAILNLFSLFFGQPAPASWLAIAILYLAPAGASLLQLGLSRAREYDADLEGAMLTGDPAGLASALQKLDRIMGRFWEDMMFPMPGRRMPQPSLLRSHPSVEDRVARLRDLDPRRTHPRLAIREIPVETMIAVGPVGLRARYRFPGVWY